MTVPDRLPGGMPVETFLRDYWQKKPLVIRQAFSDGVRCPVDADELAGLACEQAVESRIVVEEENGHPWQLHNGPFSTERFTSPPAGNWTLLVQGLDHWVPEVADILDDFRFIPNWRLDDIMASYAPPGGSVGPHYDQYDVFLVQAQGHRRWQFGGQCGGQSPRIGGTPLRILKDWQPEQNVVLEPGDMLYLPPGIGHHGVSALLADSRTGLPDNPGTIGPDVLDQLQAEIQSRISDRRQLALWFGQFSTAPKNSDIVIPAEPQATTDDLVGALSDAGRLRWNEGSRFAYTELSDQTALFVDGERYLLSGDARPLAPLLCASSRPDTATIAVLCQDPALAELMTVLYNQGSLYFE